ncbi:MAG: hypothetical protein C4521_07245 [Actinobacteria bacterium]|nr:MAG: hypothetical protein C4521_07245 [Actinomycetota bacterium]
MSLLKVFGVSIDEREAVELERIILDGDGKDALRFLERIQKRVQAQQANKLQSHLDGVSDPAGSFAERTGDEVSHGKREPGDSG